MPENIANLLQEMRELRRKADALNQLVVADHRPYLNPHFPGTFFRLPSKPPEKEDGVNVTPTCTAFMSLALCGKFEEVLSLSKTDELRAALLNAQKELLGAPWDTGSLRPNNAFTTTLVLRAAGYLYR